MFVHLRVEKKHKPQAQERMTYTRRDGGVQQGLGGPQFLPPTPEGLRERESGTARLEGTGRGRVALFFDSQLAA